MIKEDFTLMALQQAHKEYPEDLKGKGKAFAMGAHFAYGFLSPDIELVDSFRRVLAVARMANNNKPDIRVTKALRDHDKLTRQASAPKVTNDDSK